MTPKLADVRQLRLPTVRQPKAGPVRALVRRRIDGSYTIDEWGFDSDALEVFDRVADVRWSVSFGGGVHVPHHGGVLLVANRRPPASVPILVAHAVHEATGRRVRFAGIPDRAPTGPLLRRIGGVLDRPDEIMGLLRDGHLVAVFASAERRTGRVGAVHPRLVAPALALGVPVLPVAAMGKPFTRAWRVEVGADLPRRRQAGPLAEVELAEAAREGIQTLLDESTPPHWPYWS